MKNLETHTKQLKDNRNPGHEIGEFLLRHSNSIGYLVSQLEGYLEVLRQDQEAEREFAANLWQTIKATHEGD